MKKKQEEKKIKCIVWDLDNTIWNGVLVEDDQISLRENIVEIIKTLDGRGILQSIASKNDNAQAMARLEKYNINNYFLYPQINWGPKSVSIQKIAKSLNFGINTFAFIDDQEFEREEVKFFNPEVLCIDAENIEKLLDMPEMNPRFITDDSKKRREMYLSDIKRNTIEENFEGSQDEFLSTLGMIFTLVPASEEDLKRAEELTIRTHQLNSTGYTYSYDELNNFRQSDKHLLLVATLDDKYGTYGKIGLCLIEMSKDIWIIKLLLMSCRVMSRGVGSVMINHTRNMARKKRIKLRAEFHPTDVNRIMYMTYKFTHFTEYEKNNDLIIFENDLAEIQPFPDYLKVIIK